MKNISDIELKLKNVVQDGNTLVYFASGSQIRKAYRSLPYKNIFLVDKGFSRDPGGRNRIPVVTIEDNIICLGMDCLEAVFLLKKINCNIDCFVSINEGLNEGGGDYAINSDSFLGYAFPVLADSFIHIGYRNYYTAEKYQHLKEHWLDLPYENRAILKESDPEYIPPAFFTNDKRYAANAEVTRLSKKSTRQHTINKGDKEISILHSSIWDNTKALDAVFVRFENKRQKEVILSNEQSPQPEGLKIFPLYVNNHPKYNTQFTTYDFDAILSLCKSKKWKHIGLVPNQGAYQKLIEKITSDGMEYPEKISFYHLNQDDFADLYEMM